MISKNRKIFFVILGFGLFCSLDARPYSCEKDQVLLRHFGAEDDICRADGDLDFKPWYHRHEYYDAHEYTYKDPTGRLDDDSSWPSQREEFSDYLLRDLNNNR